MGNKILKKIGAAALAIMMLAIFAQIQVSAQESLNEEQNELNEEQTENELLRRKRSLVGTWNAQVTARNCQTGAEIVSFPATATFNFGGTAIVSEAGIAPAVKTPAQGVWSHLDGNTYRFKTKAFNFNANGSFTGWLIINQEAKLNRRANRYVSTGTAETYNPNGTLLFTGCSTTIGVRFE